MILYKRIVLLFFLFCLSFLSCVNKQVVCYSSISNERKYLAEIVAVDKSFLFFTYFVDGSLVVKNTSTDTKVFELILLRNRDHISDIKEEFNGLSWEGDSIVLNCNRIYYKGDDIIDVGTIIN